MDPTLIENTHVYNISLYTASTHYTVYVPSLDIVNEIFMAEQGEKLTLSVQLVEMVLTNNFGLLFHVSQSN